MGLNQGLHTAACMIDCLHCSRDLAAIVRTAGLLVSQAARALLGALEADAHLPAQGWIVEGCAKADVIRQV